MKRIYSLNLSLRDANPKVTRTISVNENITVSQLCYVIMAVYEMHASHLFSLKVDDDKNKTHEYHLPIYLNEWRDEKNHYNIQKTKFSTMLLKYHSNMVFEYDFGDSWTVDITIISVELIRNCEAFMYPSLIKGNGYGILEDIGGVHVLNMLYNNEDEVEELKNFLELEGTYIENLSFHEDEMKQRIKKISYLYEWIYEHDYVVTDEDIEFIENHLLTSIPLSN